MSPPSPPPFSTSSGSISNNPFVGVNPPPGSGYILSGSGGGGSTSIAATLSTISGAWGLTETCRIPGENPKIVLEDKTEIDLKLLSMVLTQLTDILCLAREDREAMERYPALREAYEEYRLAGLLTKG